MTPSQFLQSNKAEGEYIVERLLEKYAKHKRDELIAEIKAKANEIATESTPNDMPTDIVNLLINLK